MRCICVCTIQATNAVTIGSEPWPQMDMLLPSESFILRSVSFSVGDTTPSLLLVMLYSRWLINNLGFCVVRQRGNHPGCTASLACASSVPIWRFDHRPRTMCMRPRCWLTREVDGGTMIYSSACSLQRWHYSSDKHGCPTDLSFRGQYAEVSKLQTRTRLGVHYCTAHCKGSSYDPAAFTSIHVNPINLLISSLDCTDHWFIQLQQEVFL